MGIKRFIAEDKKFARCMALFQAGCKSIGYIALTMARDIASPKFPFCITLPGIA
jgi:hypothetical protein